MKVTIDFDETELQPIIQAHLDTGKPVQYFIRAAVNFLLHCQKIEKSGKVLGSGSSDMMARYHTVMKTREFVDDVL